jgi:pyruvate formate lyase activating enzyme
MNGRPSLKDVLASYTVEGELSEPMEKKWVRCYACGHRCKIPPGKEGICKVRFNEEGTLRVPWGYVAGLQVDPVEKKPFFHAYPGAKALSFGMLGCDYHCPYCQNWITSQAIRDPEAVAGVDAVGPDEIVDMALRYKASIVTSTYNEPLITSEWAVAIFKRAREKGLTTSYVSNGNATPEVLEYLLPWVDLFKIDLKGFTQKEYSRLGGKLENVLETIRQVYRMGMWTEIVTLVVPGFNDSDEELTSIAESIASVSADIPWHVTAFHQDYKMTDAPPTSVRTLTRAASIGSTAGLRYVYAGNIPGQAGSLEDTRCHACDTTVIQRRGFHVLSNTLRDGACPSCATPLPGRW